MKQTSVLERDAVLDELALTSATAADTLNVTVVYHNTETHAWAKEVYGRLAKLGGKNRVRATWWKISDLVEPGVLAGAVSTAMRAEVIVVAIDAVEGLPFPFNVWVDTWLPNRMHDAGCLIALLGGSEQANGCLNRARDYLRAVASAGRFKFLIEERRFPDQPAPMFRQPTRGSRTNLHPVEVQPLGVGRGVIHRAA